VGAGASSLLLPGCGGPRRPARPPNILLILADDVGAGDIGCYGGGLVDTPHIDALAREGMRFETCWATPRCSPSRVELLTGRYAGATGWWNYVGRAWSPAPDSGLYRINAHITFADALREHGYRTAVAGKWQLPGAPPGPNPNADPRRAESLLVYDAGFDEYCVWAWLHGLPPGARYHGREERPGLPARYWQPGILQDGALRPTGPEDFGPDLFADYLIDFMDRHREQPFLAYYPTVLAHRPWERPPVPEHPGARGADDFASNVAYLDHTVGRVVRAVDELGLRDDTLVIFTADNGSLGDKGQATEAGVRVPLIARGAGVAGAGTTSPALVDLSDMLPTLVEVAGGQLLPGYAIDGKSMAPTLRGEGGRHREWIYSYLGLERMLRDERWLLQGDGHLFDCGTSRDGTDYRDVTGSSEPEVVAARARFDAILASLHGPGSMLRELVLPRDLEPGGRYHEPGLDLDEDAS
jgi:arylsulfatase A-like enzyme